MTPTTARREAMTSWWHRLRRRAAPRQDAGEDAADLGTCFGLEAVLQAEEEARAFAAARDAAERRDAAVEVRPAV